VSFDASRIGESVGIEVEDALKEHMGKQPYSCTCQDCGEEVKLIIDIDTDFDMRVIVPVCECATKEEN